MKIFLPNGEKKELNDKLELQEKITLVNELTGNFMDEILIGWETPLIMNFLDCLSSYLCWHKEEEEIGTEDKNINSKWKEEKSNGKRKSSTLLFSNLAKEERSKLGLGDNFE